jgi:hypothetical protein
MEIIANKPDIYGKTIDLLIKHHSVAWSASSAKLKAEKEGHDGLSRLREAVGAIRSSQDVRSNLMSTADIGTEDDVTASIDSFMTSSHGQNPRIPRQTPASIEASLFGRIGTPPTTAIRGQDKNRFKSSVRRSRRDCANARCFLWNACSGGSKRTLCQSSTNSNNDKYLSKQELKTRRRAFNQALVCDPPMDANTAALYVSGYFNDIPM